ncbi:MAG: DUF4149 domain-containing protein [Actinobacteria bacterium]|nr:DUF4149 domain-containing protein [Actinomycetota bacterium]
MIRPLAWLWAGVVIGVSFIATPIKFTADSLTRPVALDVGRATFHALALTEWVLLAVLALLIWREHWAGRRVPRAVVWCAGFILVVLVLQTGWLLPALDERVESIIDGIEPPPSPLHMVYGVLEVAKVFALIALGVVAPPLADRQTNRQTRSADGADEPAGLVA